MDAIDLDRVTSSLSQFSLENQPHHQNHRHNHEQSQSNSSSRHGVHSHLSETPLHSHSQQEKPPKHTHKFRVTNILDTDSDEDEEEHQQQSDEDEDEYEDEQETLENIAGIETSQITDEHEHEYTSHSISTNNTHTPRNVKLRRSGKSSTGLMQELSSVLILCFLQSFIFILHLFIPENHLVYHNSLFLSTTYLFFIHLRAVYSILVSILPIYSSTTSTSTSTTSRRHLHHNIHYFYSSPYWKLRRIPNRFVLVLIVLILITVRIFAAVASCYALLFADQFVHFTRFFSFLLTPANAYNRVSLLDNQCVALDHLSSFSFVVFDTLLTQTPFSVIL